MKSQVVKILHQLKQQESRGSGRSWGYRPGLRLKKKNQSLSTLQEGFWGDGREVDAPAAEMVPSSCSWKWGVLSGFYGRAFPGKL